MPRVFILGAGRAGNALASAFSSSGIEVVGIHGRRPLPAQPRVSSGPLPASITTADVVLVTVKDSQLDQAVDELLEAPLKPGAAVLHASGSGDPRGIEELRARGHPAGTFHPLVPLRAESEVQNQLADTWIGIDGDATARAAAAELAASVGANVMSIPPGKKASYHAAAVLASNFPTVLAYLARQLLATTGVRTEEASAAVVALMHASVENLRGRDPAAALTGPVVRGDVRTVEAHIAALTSGASADPELLQVYLVLTRVAVEMARRQGMAGDALNRIAELVAEA